ncbi:unnamed protein product [Didymodactylos carnosus]|uniref:WH2 domain-containing protein n=1 Tax=Didymodactylos carnosus TaxID=1234261 RepID=A0A814B507_9BILA|nr:unnamed protein product [Didymodactylos carnosus]CAF1217259.1 unnamed protein product [Didymodactylos carnosus]CAF3701116.1 unnamed protein product [Didymodactylos carnosus]CAF4025606.1 unnamed protein product [Didymodactylos carnosus]
MEEDALWISLLAILIIILSLGLFFFICCLCAKYRQRSPRERRLSSTADIDTPLLQRLTQPKRERELDGQRSALLTCHFYVRCVNEYTFYSQLSQIGYRIDKYWFLLSPKQGSGKQASIILSLFPKSDRFEFPHEESVYITILNELFSYLYHPYVEQIKKIDYIQNQLLFVIVKDYQTHGSLKDFIHGVVPTGQFNGKYSYRNSGISLERVHLYSTQILEGLLYLKEKSIPPLIDLHSGNIIIARNGECVQIGSYEYSFLQERSRIASLVKRSVQNLQPSIADGMSMEDVNEVICFGRLIFEMVSGYELDTITLTPKHWHDCRDDGVRQLLTKIFDTTKPVLTLKEIRKLPYFQNSPPLIELKNFQPILVEYSQDIKSILDQTKEQIKASAAKTKPNLTRTVSVSNKRSSGSLRKSSTTLSTRRSTTITPTSFINLNFKQQPKLADVEQIDMAKLPSRPPPPAPNIPPPPGPPPPPPPLLVTKPKANTGGEDDRSALLGDIRHGLQLKKTATNDRSAPKFK